MFKLSKLNESYVKAMMDRGWRFTFVGDMLNGVLVCNVSLKRSPLTNDEESYTGLGTSFNQAVTNLRNRKGKADLLSIIES